MSALKSQFVTQMQMRNNVYRTADIEHCFDLSSLIVTVSVTDIFQGADIHCVFWYACTDTVPALLPAFSRANGLGSVFFSQDLVSGVVTNHMQKSPSQAYIAWSKCRSH